MTNFGNGRHAMAKRWGMVLCGIPALCLVACADETSAPPAADTVTVTARIVNNQTGVVRETTGTIDRSVFENTIDDTGEKVGCVHIRFCRTTFVTSNDVLCDTNDIVSSTCTSNRRFSECGGDADVVCGRTRPMGFDPAIPCPISGVPTSFCAAGESLVWINF